MCMRACMYTRADTFGASAFTWSACCTSRPCRAPLIYGDRINYKEQIEKSVNRVWRTVSAIILLCLPSLPRLAHDRLSLADEVQIFDRRIEFRFSRRVISLALLYLESPRAKPFSFFPLFFLDASRLLSRVMQLKLAFYARGLRRPKRRSLR